VAGAHHDTPVNSHHVAITILVIVRSYTAHRRSTDNRVAPVRLAFCQQGSRPPAGVFQSQNSNFHGAFPYWATVLEARALEGPAVAQFRYIAYRIETTSGRQGHIMNRLWISLVIVAAPALFACNSARDDWNKAAAANTIAGYKEFLSKHPSAEHSVEAGNRIYSLQDDKAWQQAQRANLPDAYRDYLDKQPAGAHTKAAQEALARQERVADWKSAEKTGTVAALQDFLRRHPVGSEADWARLKLTQLSGYKVQIGPSGTEKRAQRQRDRLHAKHGDILPDVRVVPVGSGKGYGVESAPMSRAQADSVCTELKTAHENCEVVRSDVNTG